jgi:predicted extracellular nuclease
MRSRLLTALVLVAILLSPMVNQQKVHAASPGDLVINEIMQNPSAVADAAGEWFEIFNPTDADIDINGWTIEDNDYDNHTIANGGPLLVPAGGYLVLGNNTDSDTNGGAPVAYSYGSSWYLSNGADEVVLLDGSLVEIDRVEYDGGTNFPDPNGASMSLKDPTLDNNLGENWCTASTPFGDGDLGTPGAENDCLPFGVCGDPFTPIYEIQGDGVSSPLSGEVVNTEGIVTVDLQMSSELSGFFIQDRKGDGDPATSDGLFVYHRDYWSPSFDPSVGDLVRVQGTISEYYGQTEMRDLEAGTICGSGFQPVATNVFARDFNANAEAYEGMYVRFPRPMVVTDTYNQHSYGEVWLGENGVVEQPTNEYPVGSDSATLAEDNMARSVLLDDSSTWSYPDPVPFTRDEGTLRLGDKVKNPLVGAINYDYGAYRIQTQDPASVRFIPQNARPGELTTFGDLVVASANVLNYWTTLGGRGASSPEQLEVQTEKLVAELLGTGADIIGLQEMENDPTDTPIVTLVAALNAAEGADVWSWVEGFEPNSYPIRNEIIYRNDRVETVGDPVTVIDDIFDYIPPGREDPVGRRPVAQTFMFNGETFTVVNNHFKSKGCDGASGDDLNQDDGQSCFNATRVGQAERVLELVDDLVADTGDTDVMVIGDLNSYLDEDPVLTLETQLVHLVRDWDIDPYSYAYFNTADAPWIGRGLLDHALATPSLADHVKRAEVWHVNADEPRFLDWYDPTIYAPGPYRASDHDPVIVSLKLK